MHAMSAGLKAMTTFEVLTRALQARGSVTGAAWSSRGTHRVLKWYTLGFPDGCRTVLWGTHTVLTGTRGGSPQYSLSQVAVGMGELRFCLGGHGVLLAAGIGPMFLDYMT